VHIFSVFFMKLFRTSRTVSARECQPLFGLDPPRIVVAKRFDKFIAIYVCLVAVCCRTAMLS